MVFLASPRRKFDRRRRGRNPGTSTLKKEKKTKTFGKQKEA
jgi:hypothetical protein